MHITVAICKFNRADLLDRTLAQMRTVRVPDGTTWEILVVNNRCTDNTDEVIARHLDTLPVRRLFEPAPGHANARNHAVREATGDFLIWTDDDVLVEPDWLEAFATAVHDHPAAAVFAGRVNPWFEEPPAGWVARHIDQLSGVIVCVDHGPERALRAGDAIFGANLGVRLETARAFPFNPKLGRVGKNLVGGDDTDFLGRVLGDGRECRWLPTARVRHFVPRARVQPDYIIRWFRDGGRTFVKRGMLQPSVTVARMPLWAVRKLATETARRVWWTRSRDARWFAAFRESLLLQGILLESRATSLDGAPSSPPTPPVRPGALNR